MLLPGVLQHAAPTQPAAPAPAPQQQPRPQPTRRTELGSAVPFATWTDSPAIAAARPISAAAAGPARTVAQEALTVQVLDGEEGFPGDSFDVAADTPSDAAVEDAEHAQRPQGAGQDGGEPTVAHGGKSRGANAAKSAAKRRGKVAAVGASGAGVAVPAPHMTRLQASAQEAAAGKKESPRKEPASMAAATRQRAGAQEAKAVAKAEQQDPISRPRLTRRQAGQQEAMLEAPLKPRAKQAGQEQVQEPQQAQHAEVEPLIGPNKNGRGGAQGNGGAHGEPSTKKKGRQQPGGKSGGPASQPQSTAPLALPMGVGRGCGKCRHVHTGCTTCRPEAAEKLVSGGAGQGRGGGAGQQHPTRLLHAGGACHLSPLAGCL